jgi:hypothetical protein
MYRIPGPGNGLISDCVRDRVSDIVREATQASYSQQRGAAACRPPGEAE